MHGAPLVHDTHRRPTDADEHPTARRVQHPPRLRTQAALLALVPTVIWAVTHPAAMLVALATLAVATAAIAVARRRPGVLPPVPLAE